MKGCTHSGTALAATCVGILKLNARGVWNISALVIPFRKSNFELPQLKIVYSCLHFRFWQFECFIDYEFSFCFLFCWPAEFGGQFFFFFVRVIFKWSAPVAVYDRCNFYCIHLRVWWAWLQLMVVRKCNEGLAGLLAISVRRRAFLIGLEQIQIFWLILSLQFYCYMIWSNITFNLISVLIDVLFLFVVTY